MLRTLVTPTIIYLQSIPIHMHAFKWFSFYYSAFTEIRLHYIEPCIRKSIHENSPSFLESEISSQLSPAAMFIALIDVTFTATLMDISSTHRQAKWFVPSSIMCSLPEPSKTSVRIDCAWHTLCRSPKSHARRTQPRNRIPYPTRGKLLERTMTSYLSEAGSSA